MQFLKQFEFTPEELQRMDDDRSEREVYRMEDAQERCGFREPNEDDESE